MPALTLAAAVHAPNPLPKFARLVDGKDQPRAAWTYDHHVRQTFYRDVYFPLTPPSWRAGDPVEVLEYDRLLPDDAPTRVNIFNPPGPRDGALSRGDLEPWRLDAMRRAGLHLADRPVVLERQPLDGRLPGADWVVGFLWLDFAFAVVFVSAIFAWRASREVKRLRDAQVTSKP